MKSTLLLVCVLFAACATTGTNTTKLRVGMSKAEVIAVMGKPASVNANGPIEVLNYDPPPWEITPYFARLNNGTLEAFGLEHAR